MRVSPVTQEVEVAVNKPVRKGAPCPSRVAKGSIKSSAPSRITAANPRATIWAGESLRIK